MTAGVRIQGGTGGSRTLLLLHGMGATGDVWEPWRPLLTRWWPGRWLAPDLPGHGRSPHLDRYSFDTLAAGVAGLLDRPEPVVVLGHSLGGAVALALAGGRFGVPVAAAVAVGIKVAWTAEELDRARSLARRPVVRYATRSEAVVRYLRTSGLAGLFDEGDAALDSGLRRDAGQWRLAMDPAAFAVGAPDMPSLLAAVSVPVVLARGERDPMVTDEHLAGLRTDDPTVSAVTLAGLGHNAHVEDPAAVIGLLAPFR